MRQEAAAQLDLFRDGRREMHAAVESGLVAISQLPPDLRASWKAKATLAEMLFSGTHGKPPNRKS